MIVLNDTNIILHIPKTGGVFFRSWLLDHVPPQYITFSHGGSRHVAEYHYDPKVIKFWHEVRAIEPEYRELLESDARDTMHKFACRSDHMTIQKLNPEYLRGKKIFFFTREPMSWLYSKAKFQKQIGLVETFKQGVEEVDMFDQIQPWHWCDHLRIENCELYMMKYEYLYANIIQILTMSGVPVTNDMMKTLVEYERLNEAEYDNISVNKEVSIEELRKKYQQVDPRIAHFYEEEKETPWKLCDKMIFF